MPMKIPPDNKQKNFIQKAIQQETVLCAAFVLAAVSSLIIPPDSAYRSYIDWNTLLLLFALMAVMAGFQKLGILRQSAKNCCP